MKPRKLYSQIDSFLASPDKPVIFLWGPRQTGKSTILNALKDKYGGAYFNFDNLEDKRLFVPELTRLESAIGLQGNSDTKYIFIDEVQNHPESTLAIKLLADSGKYTLIATGSSELQAKTNAFDSLAGRYHEFILFPLTLDEIAIFKSGQNRFFDTPDPSQSQYLSAFIDEAMLYGSYPKIVLSANKIDELKLLSRDAIAKDIINIYHLKNSDLVYDLLRLLATQIGNLINITELSSSLKTTKTTIDNYLSILSRNRIIYFLEPYKTNARRGYLERRKVYFYDLGIRNALIEDFRPFSLRSDTGAMFENLVVLGVLRQIHYHHTNSKLYFFRQISGSQKEIDLIIESTQGIKNGYEIKFAHGQVNRFPQLDISSYQAIDKLSAPSFLV